jgi:hypothetical protein
LAVKVEAGGQQSSGNKSGINFSNTIFSQGLFSFSSSMGQLFQLHQPSSTFLS